MSEDKGKASESGFPPGGDEFTLGDLTKALRRNFWITLGVFAATFALAAAFGMSRTKVYRASATLQIDPKPPAPLGRGVEGVVELGTGSVRAALGTLTGRVGSNAGSDAGHSLGQSSVQSFDSRKILRRARDS